METKAEKKDGKATATAAQEKTTATPIAKAIEQPKVDDIKKMLDVQIHKWEQLSLRIEHRERFLQTKEQLKKYAESLKSEKEKNNPEQDIFSLKLQSKDNYSGRSEISVNNLFIIEEFLTFINSKIEVKILQLEKEIVM